MRILVLHSGGTISCEEKNGVLTPSLDIKPEFDLIKRRVSGVSFTHKKMTPFLSEYLNGVTVSRVVKEIKKAVSSEKYGGIILTHGSDTVAYTAAALGYALGVSCIPVVCVCADLPLSNPSSSGHVNLLAATALIASGEVKGVFSVYRTSETAAAVFRATRILRHRTYESELTSCAQPYGAIELGSLPSGKKPRFIAPENRLFAKNPLYSEKADELPPLKVSLKKTCPITYITVTPGMKYPSLPRGCKAVILGSYHSGTVDTSSAETKRFAKDCKRRNIPVFVDGVGSTADYESMLAYKELGLTRLPSLSSPVAMYMKLWILAENGVSAFTEAIKHSLCGDLPD